MKGVLALQAAPTTRLLNDTISFIVPKLTEDTKRVQVSHDTLQPALHTLGALKQGVRDAGGKCEAPHLSIIRPDVRGMDAPLPWMPRRPRLHAREGHGGPRAAQNICCIVSNFQRIGPWPILS